MCLGGMENCKTQGLSDISYKQQRKDFQKSYQFLKATRTLAETITINVFRTLDINKTFSATWGTLTQEKDHNSEKNKIYSILTSPSPILLFWAHHTNLENQRSTIMWKASSLEPLEGKE